jgi:nitroreductase
MTVQDLIKHRVSVRSYLDKPVERDKIITCLEAARLAPSACNVQPWKFIIVDDIELKNQLCDKAFKGLYSLSSFARAAPVIIAIVSEKTNILTRVGGEIRGVHYYLIDIGIAGEHFVLQAQELGLGTCWIGWFNEKAVKSILHIPKRKKIEVLLSLGYPDEEGISSKHDRKELNKIAFFNSYKAVSNAL